MCDFMIFLMYQLRNKFKLCVKVTAVIQLLGKQRQQYHKFKICLG